MTHRKTEESRQIAFFRAPAASAAHPHRHVLPQGSNWSNLFTPISGELGAAAEFFRQRRIKWWHSPATGDLSALSGPTHNTLSSQVVCVNVLMPLRNDEDALTALLRHIDPEVERVVPVQDGHVQEPSLVEFEWVGARGKNSLEDTPPTRGARVTSSDAFMIGRLRNGELRGYLMEWKYVETGDEVNKGSGAEGQTRRKRYGGLFPRVYREGASLDDFLVDPVYQLMRLSLLGTKIVNDVQITGVRSVRTVLICPRGNSSYRTTRPLGMIRQRLAAGTVADALRSKLLDPSTFIDSAPEELVSAVRALPNHPPAQRDWLDYMQARYAW